MCAVGEKLIQFPDNCGVVDYFVDPSSCFKQRFHPYPLIYVNRSTECYDNPEFIANWDAWKPSWLEKPKWPQYPLVDDSIRPAGVIFGTAFIVKAPGVANWCAECNVMQAQPLLPVQVCGLRQQAVQ